MQGKSMLKRIIFIIKLALLPVLGWPLSKDATRLKTICVQLYHYLGIILAICSQVSLIYTIINRFDDFILLVVLILFLSSITHSIGNFIFHRIYRQRIQVITYIYVHFIERISEVN